MSVILPSIKDVPFGDKNKEIFDSIKLTLDTRAGQRGGVEDRWITGQDLIELGLVTKDDIEQMLRER